MNINSGAGVPQAISCCIQTCFGHFCNDTSAQHYWSQPFPWTTLMVWREEMCYIGNWQFSIKKKILPRPVSTWVHFSITWPAILMLPPAIFLFSLSLLLTCSPGTHSWSYKIKRCHTRMSVTCVAWFFSKQYMYINHYSYFSFK